MENEHITVEEFEKYLKEAYSITPSDRRLGRMERIGSCVYKNKVYFFFRDTQPIEDARIRYYTDRDLAIDAQMNKKRA